jgi:hypothetical protein
LRGASLFRPESLVTIIESLAHDHRVLEATLTELSATPSSEAAHRSDLFGRIQGLLQAHARAEEVVVYAPLRRMMPSEIKTLEAYEEHHIADLMLQELGADCPGGKGWTAKVRVFEEVLRHHIKEEELHLFALLTSEFDEAALTEMEDDFQTIKHEGLELMLGPVRRATPAFIGRALVSAQARAGRYARQGELVLRRRWNRIARAREPLAVGTQG